MKIVRKWNKVYRYNRCTKEMKRKTIFYITFRGYDIPFFTSSMMISDVEYVQETQREREKKNPQQSHYDSRTFVV